MNVDGLIYRGCIDPVSTTESYDHEAQIRAGHHMDLGPISTIYPLTINPRYALILSSVG